MRRPDDPTTSTDAGAGETFVGRWSRRKRSAVAQAQTGPGADESPAPAPSSEHASGAQTESVASPARPAGDTERAAVLTDADMPDLDLIGADGDYSGFLSSGVSETLRNKALRQLFMSPQFNVLDGLNDYDEDFTSFEPLGDLVTSDMRHRVEMEAQRAAREAQARPLTGGESEQQALEEQAVRQDAIEQEGGEQEGGEQEGGEQEGGEHETPDEQAVGAPAMAADAIAIERYDSDAHECATDAGSAVGDTRRRSAAVVIAGGDAEDV